MGQSSSTVFFTKTQKKRLIRKCLQVLKEQSVFHESLEAEKQLLESLSNESLYNYIRDYYPEQLDSFQ